MRGESRANPSPNLLYPLRKTADTDRGSSIRLPLSAAPKRDMHWYPAPHSWRLCGDHAPCRTIRRPGTRPFRRGGSNSDMEEHRNRPYVAILGRWSIHNFAGEMDGKGSLACL